MYYFDQLTLKVKNRSIFNDPKCDDSLKVIKKNKNTFDCKTFTQSNSMVLQYLFFCVCKRKFFLIKKPWVLTANIPNTKYDLILLVKLFV